MQPSTICLAGQSIPVKLERMWRNVLTSNLMVRIWTGHQRIGTDTSLATTWKRRLNVLEMINQLFPGIAFCLKLAVNWTEYCHFRALPFLWHSLPHPVNIAYRAVEPGHSSGLVISKRTSCYVVNCDSASPKNTDVFFRSLYRCR